MTNKTAFTQGLFIGYIIGIVAVFTIYVAVKTFL